MNLTQYYTAKSTPTLTEALEDMNKAIRAHSRPVQVGQIAEARKVINAILEERKTKNSDRASGLGDVEHYVGAAYAEKVRIALIKLEQSEWPCCDEECNGKLTIDMGDYMICDGCGGI